MKALYALLCILIVAVVVLGFLTVQKSGQVETEAKAREKAEEDLQTARGEVQRLTQDTNPRQRRSPRIRDPFRTRT